MANDSTQDVTYLSFVLIGKYSLRLIKLVIVIATITYFLGMFWFIICIELEHATEEFNSHANPAIYNIENYIDTNGLEFDSGHKYNGDLTSHTDKTVQLMYFAYTTLSTVGFGDKTPQSDYERLIICGILLLGVSLFGYIMDVLVIIIDEFKAFDAEIDEGNELIKFFSLIKHFNDGIDFDI